MKDRIGGHQRSQISGILFALILSLAFLSGCGNGREEEAVPAGETEGTAQENDRDEAVVWQGERYIYNDHLSNFLFLGIDTRETEQTETGMADAGQADALYLLSYDRTEKTTTLISIPRDTMTAVEVFDREGQSLGLTEQHISLAYGYGDGSYGSLELAEQAVSSLFYGLPIQSSCAMSMDGLAVLMESFGDVTVTVPNDSLAEKHPEFQEGAEAVITAENAEIFLRTRDINETQSALARMERQQAFLKAFGETAAERYGDNPEALIGVYEALSPYLVSSIGDEWLLKLAEAAVSGGAQAEWTVPGEGVPGEPFDEYLVDDSAFYELILQTFYEKEET